MTATDGSNLYAGRTRLAGPAEKYFVVDSMFWAEFWAEFWADWQRPQRETSQFVLSAMQLNQGP